MYPEINTILYATDMGDHMRPVFRFALGLAKKYEAEIIMLHVVEPPSIGVQFAIDAYMPEVDTRKVLENGLQNTLDKMKERLQDYYKNELLESPSDSGLTTDVKVVSGRSADMIVRQAESMDVDMIIMGTHTDPSFSTHIIGSTARRVTQMSKKPVLVIPVYE